MTTTHETFEWEGARLQVWSFAKWKDLETFVDDFCPPAYVATIKYELHEQGITGVVFSADPLDVTTAVAAYRITDPEPEDGP